MTSHLHHHPIMAFLVGIPVELLGLVCSNLSIGDILSLCKSCKGLYSAAHPLLFRHITIAWDRTAAPDEPPNFTPFLLFILRHPPYARYIKTVDIPYVNYEACDDLALRLSYTGKSPSLSPEETALVRDAIDELWPPGPDAEKWYTAVAEEAHLGAIISFILGLCTHLERLTVDIDFLPPQNRWLFNLVISPAVSTPRPASRLSIFDKLTHLTVSSLYKPDVNLPTETFLLCFYLPSVTTLCFDDALLDLETITWDPTSPSHQGPAWPLAQPPLAASLTILQLDMTCARPGAVEFLLRHTPNLQSLVYNCNLPSSSSPFDVPALRKGLDHVRGTLARLAVRFEIFADEALDPQSLLAVVRGSLGPLDSLTALEDLEVSLGVLLGQVGPQDAPPLAHVLPPGLKRLVINDDLWNYNAFLAWEGEPVGTLLMDFFADGCKAATPQLEEFVLDMSTHNYIGCEYWGNYGGQKALRQLVESQGIRCSIWGEIESSVDYQQSPISD